MTPSRSGTRLGQADRWCSRSGTGTVPLARGSDGRRGDAGGGQGQRLGGRGLLPGPAPSDDGSVRYGVPEGERCGHAAQDGQPAAAQWAGRFGAPAVPDPDPICYSV